MTISIQFYFVKPVFFVTHLKNAIFFGGGENKNAEIFSVYLEI